MSKAGTKRGAAWALLGVGLAACAGGAAPVAAPSPAPSAPTAAVSPEPVPPSAPAPSVAPVASAPAAPSAASAGPARAEPAPSLSELEQRVRDAGFGALAEIVASRVAQTRRKMKLTEAEAQGVCQALLSELPSMPEAQKMLSAMPKASIELVRSVRERGVPRAEAERIATFLLEARAALDMDNPAAFDENCSHVVGREWQDIDYRDEGMKWEKQQSIYVPKGVLHFKDVANFRQFFRVESKAPYFQKVYGVKGQAP